MEINIDEKGLPTIEFISCDKDKLVSCIMSNIALHGVGGHGSFITTFAEAFIRADAANRSLLLPVAIKLADKYDLWNEV
jgi:hypothetical protein